MEFFGLRSLILDVREEEPRSKQKTATIDHLLVYAIAAAAGKTVLATAGLVLLLLLLRQLLQLPLLLVLPLPVMISLLLPILLLPPLLQLKRQLLRHAAGSFVAIE